MNEQKEDVAWKKTRQHPFQLEFNWKTYSTEQNWLFFEPGHHVVADFIHKIPGYDQKNRIHRFAKGFGC
jgi:hypothetical protein